MCLELSDFYFAALSSANQYEVGHDVDALNYASDQLMLLVTDYRSTCSDQFSSCAVNEA